MQVWKLEHVARKQEALTYTPDLLRDFAALQNGINSIVHLPVEKHH